MAKKGEVKYTDLFASDVHFGLLELEADFRKLDAIAQSFSKTITGTKARINITIKEQSAALKENKNELIAVDVANHGAAEAIRDLSKATEENIRKSRSLKEQQEGLNRVFDISTAGVDEIKQRIRELTKEYNSLGRATDQDKAKMSALATQVSKLKTEQDQLTNSLKKANTSLNVAEGSYLEASRKLSQLRKELMNMPGAFNKVTGELNKSTPAVRQHLIEIEKLDRGIKKMDASMGVHGRNVGAYRGAIASAASSIAGWAAAYLSATEAIGFVFNKSLDLDAIRAAMSVSLGSMEAVDQKMAQLRATAERLGVEYVVVAKSYKQFIGGAIASQFPLEEAEKVFMSVVNASSKMKLSSEQTEGALRALEQMISKGNVQAEELRGQLGERLPGAFAIAARAMGVTTKELNKMLENGQVLAVDLLPKLAKELDKTFGNDITKKTEGLTAAWANFKSVFQIGVDENSNISAFFETVLKGITNISGTILKTVNSTGWNEFFARLTSNQAADVIRGLNTNLSAGQNTVKSSYAFDPTSASPDRVAVEYNTVATAYKNAAAALEAYKKGIAGKQLGKGGYTEMDDYKNIQKYNSMLDLLGAKMGQLSVFMPKAAKATSGALTEVADSALTSVSAIQKRISDLKKLDGSSTPGSEIDNRVKALQERLKNLRGTSQDAESALDSLRKKITKITEALQLQALAAIQANKAFKPDPETIRLLDKLQTQLGFAERGGRYDQLKPADVSKDSLRGISNTAGGPIQTPATLGGTIAANANSSREQMERIKEDMEQNIRDAVDILRESNYVIGEAFGWEMGNMFDELADNLENFLTGAGNSFEDWAQTAAAAVSAIDEQIGAASEKRIEQFEREKDYKIKLAGDNKVAIEAIEADSNKKILEERRKAARSAKIAAMFEIAINTAVAASKVVGQAGIFGLPLVPLVIGMGAVQLALVAAQPMPQFFKGTNNAPRGFAEVAEQGRELIIDKSGRARLINDHSIYHMKGGEQVISNPNTEKILENMQMDQASEGQRSILNSLNNVRLQQQEEAAKMARLDENRIGEVVAKEVGKIMAEIPMNNWNVDGEGFTRSIRKGNTTVTLVNNKNSL